MLYVLFYVVWPVFCLLSLCSAPLHAAMVLAAVCVCVRIFLRVRAAGGGLACVPRLTWVLIWPTFTTFLVLSRPWMIQSEVARVSQPLAELGAEVRPICSEVAIKAWSIRCADASLDDTRFAEWMPHLTYLKIGELSLHGSCITDRSVSEIVSLTSIGRLDLGGTRITDKALLMIAQLNRLRTLNLANTLVTDEGVKYLAEMEDLCEVDLQGTAVTDDGLERLMSLPRLDSIDVRHSRVTVDGAARFEKLHHRGSVRVSDNAMTAKASQEQAIRQAWERKKARE